MTLTDFKKKILEKVGVKPTEAQWEVLADDSRFKLITGGWRAGKSEVASLLLVLGYFLDLGTEARRRLYWIMGRDYETCRPEFEKSRDYFMKLGLIKGNVHFPDEGQCSMHLLGREGEEVSVVTRSADDEWRIAEQAPDGIIVCEAGRLPYSSWLRIRGRLIEKRAWCVLVGTLESSDGRADPWYGELYTAWQGLNDDGGRSFALPTWSNTYLFPLGENDPIIVAERNALPADLFQEKYGAVPVKPTGLVLKEFSNKIHIKDCQFDPRLPVEIAVDPGYGYPGAYAVEAIQVRDGHIYLIDEIYLQKYVTEDIITIAKQRLWWGKVQAGAIDYYGGRQHQAMPAPVEMWAKLANLRLQSKRVEVEAGIDILRSVLKVNPLTQEPILYVSPNCKGFIAECGGGKSPVPGGGMWIRDDNTGKASDKNCHATKSVIHWLVARYGYSPMVERRRKVKIHYC